MKKIYPSILLSLLGALLFSGCFVYEPAADFVKQRYTNTVSYFNTFYNAQRAFNEAEAEVIKAQKDFREKPTQSRQFVIPQTARVKFNSSVEKNSKILTFYPNSNWVEDALMMIGKAYFYMGDDLKAERKFLELFAKYPESDLINEGKLWYGKNLLRQKKYDQGIKHLEVLFAETLKNDEDIAGQASYELAQYYFLDKEFEKAEKYYTQAIGLIDDDEQRAQIQFQRGKCYDELKRYDMAEKAFAQVNDHSPSYGLLFQAELQRIKSLAKQQHYEAAVDQLNAMLGDTKNADYFGAIHLEIASTLFMKGNLDGAIEKYRFVDTAFARTDESARSYYTLGNIYETILFRYDSARTHYNRARGEFPSSEITKEAVAKADIFNKYEQRRNDLIKFDSLYTNALSWKPPVDTTLASRIDSTKLKDTLQLAKDDPKNRLATRPGKKGEAKKDSVVTIDSTNIKLQLSQQAAQKQLIDSLQRSIIRTKFEIAGLFFIEIQQSDSALFWFDDIVKNHSQSEYTPRALYTIAEIHRAVKHAGKPELDSIYTRIVNSYPQSSYAQEARKILGLPLLEAEKDSALELFEKAEALAEAKNYESAIKTYKELVVKYSQSPISPKALFTAGWHYENSIINNDSATAVYKRLIAQFPASQFASIARPKVTEYENEVKRIEQEKQKKIEEQKQKEQEEKETKELLNRPDTPQPQKADSLATPDKL